MAIHLVPGGPFVDDEDTGFVEGFVPGSVYLADSTTEPDPPSGVEGAARQLLLGVGK